MSLPRQRIIFYCVAQYHPLEKKILAFLPPTLLPEPSYFLQRILAQILLGFVLGGAVLHGGPSPHQPTPAPFGATTEYAQNT